MLSKKKKFYIATSIVYTNRRPHIGFALELIQADVLARYHRTLGEEVFFSTGTDEHGMKVVGAAKEAGKTLEDFTEGIAGQVKDLTKILNLSNDGFIRTTDKEKHYPGVKKVWLKLKENSDIYKKKYEGLYCIGCEAFIKEKDLVEGKCPIHQEAPGIVEEENYFFRLSKYQDKLQKIIENNKVKIIPESRKRELLTFINQGLEDTSCSRSREKLRWGIPVPGDASQTVYVWLDALVNYLSVLNYASNGDKFKRFWPPDVHCIGKDIFIRFHGSLWLAMLLSLGLQLPKTIFVHGFITSEGKKMSKSLGNVVDPFELVNKYGTDAVRYFLLREISPTEDGDYTRQKFESRYNNDLAKGLGNLVARVLVLRAKIFNFYPAPETSFRPGVKFSIFNKVSNSNFQTAIDKTRSTYKDALDNFKFNEALGAIWALIGFCDRYIERQKPWRLLSQGPNSKLKAQKLEEILSNLLIALKEIAQLLQPFLPQTSEEIVKQLKTKKSKPLFPRVK